MSFTILEFVKSFINERISTEVFVDAYIDLYQIERDNNLLIKDKDDVSECLSTIFCLVDLYNPNSDKEDYELNAKELSEKIKQELIKLK
ncbi:colicin immunity domain-containing protein [Neisseriaceae bacterium ESL0693]|nr:colicin immunity domain-containing protein [Neisseriaceae bacterium ESL0693]